MTPDAARELADLVESAASVRAALAAWPSRSPCDAIARAGRRAALGAPVRDFLAPLRGSADGAAVARAIEAHVRMGGSLSLTLRALAAAQQQRADLALDASAAATPSKLSTRLMGALALGCLVLVPVWRRVPPLTMLVTGSVAAGLVAIGWAWMRRLQPAPRRDDGSAVAADLLAGLLEAGLPAATAIRLALPPESPRPRRQMDLGMPGPDALAGLGGVGWAEIAAFLSHATSAGLGCSDGLRRIAVSIRERARREVEVDVKRAPVLLVLPLTLCFLPAFALVLVVPMMRGLAG